MAGFPRPARHPSIEAVEELTLEQVQSTPRTPPAVIGRVKKLRDSHHMVARLFALGLKQGEIASQTGYSYNRISIMAADPMMQELVSHYREMLNQQFVASTDEYFQTLTTVRMKTLRLISDRLDDAEPEDIPLNQLHAIHADAADRTGYPKRRESVNLNLDFADTLDKAIARSRQAKQIEASALPLGENANSAPNGSALPPTGDAAGVVAEVGSPPKTTVERASDPVIDEKPRPSTIQSLLPQPRGRKQPSFLRRDVA